MTTITRKNLIQSIARKNGLDPREVQMVLKKVLDFITETLKAGDRLEFRGFGVFEVVRRKEKVGRNPKNPEIPIPIPEHNAVKFFPGKKMKELIAKKGGE